MKKLRQLLSSLIRPHHSLIKEDQQQLSRLFATLSLSVSFIYLFTSAIRLYLNLLNFNDPQELTGFLAVAFYLLLVLIVVYPLSRSKYYKLSGTVLVLIMISTLITSVITDPRPMVYLLLNYMLLPLIVGGLIFTFTQQVIFLLLILGVVLVLPFFFSQLPFLNVIDDVFIYMLIVGVPYVLIQQFKSKQEKQKQKELLELNNQLTTIEKSKDEFFSIMSHELRTPLSRTRWGLDNIVDELPKKVQKKDFESIYINIKRITEILEIVFTYSQISSGVVTIKFESVDIIDLVPQLKSKYQDEVKKVNLKLLTLVPQSLTVFTSKDSLFFILDQYINNAIKFTSNGSITLSINEYTKETFTFHFRGQKEILENYIVISVSDTGQGIPQDDQDRIFSLYYQEGGVFGRNQEKGGLGIGLSMVQLLAQKSNYIVWFESTPKKGSTFFVAVPLSDAKTKILFNNH